MAEEIYVGVYNEGGESYELRSDECKPQDQCTDSDWCFIEKIKKFRRYYSYHDELYGNQYLHEEVDAVLVKS